MGPRFPALRHPVALLGMAITTVMAVLFLLLLPLDSLGVFHSPYFGLLIFVAVPAAFLVGLLIIPIGVRLERRRRARGESPAEWPVLDLRVPHQRRMAGVVLLLTCVNLVLLSLASFG